MPRIAAPITAAPVAVFYRFASAEFRPASAELLSASQRPRAKMFALFAMISAVSAVSALFAMSALFRQSSANGEGKGEDDRKERFHSTKYSILTARVRLPHGRREVTARTADSSSPNALNFSSARTIKRWPSPRCASAIRIVRPL
jgi:hypothetical protein